MYKYVIIRVLAILTLTEPPLTYSVCMCVHAHLHTHPEVTHLQSLAVF